MYARVRVGYKGRDMINIITANTSTRAIYSVIDEIEKNNHKEGRHVVIVPDAFALLAEKTVVERLGIDGSMNIEVVSFTRLAKKTLGGKIGHTLSKQGAVLYFQKSIKSVQGELHHYARASATDGFAGEMYAVIASLRNNGISAEQLEESALKLDGTTKDKANDILVLYKKYIETLKEFEDSTTRLDALKGECKNSTKITEAYFYVVGFDSLSKKQIEIIAELAKYSMGVTVGLPRDEFNDLYPNEAYERLVEYLEKEKVEITSSHVHEWIKSPFVALHDIVFTSSGAKVKNDGSVVVFKESNSYEQYNAVAREILRLVRREGLRYKDIAVIDCGEKASVDFKAILNRYAIPFFMDERVSLTSSLVAKYIVNVFDVARTDYRQDKVRALIKNPLFYDDSDKIALFENYVLEENVRGREFKKAFEYKIKESKNAVKEREEKKAQLVGELEDIRKLLVTLVEKFVGARKVKDFVDGVKGLLSSTEFLRIFENAISVDEKLKKLNEQSLERINGLLDEYEKLFGEDEETPAGFVKTFSSSIDAEEIALIPSYIDAVLVGSIRESALISQKAIFVLNATATSLPCEQGYQAIISALDMEKLGKSGVRLYPSPLDRMKEERFAFIDLMTKTNKLYIGYPECELDGTQNKPSQAISDICMAFRTEERRPIEPISLGEKFALVNARTQEELEDAVGQSSNAFYTLLMNGGMVEDDKKGFRERIYATLSEDEKKVIRSEKKVIKEVPLAYTFHEDKHTSASQVEQYFSCPYKHYLQSGLKLQERKEGALRVADVGDIVHKVLEEYFKSTRAVIDNDGNVKKKGIREMSVEERETEVDKAVNKVFESDEVQFLTRETMTKFLFGRLKQESKKIALKLTDNVLKGDFTPSECELYFGNKDGVDVVKFNTPYGAISFNGKIDRIDTAKIGGKDYAIAIDYKTGHVDADLSSVYYGKKIQLYLYLIAIRDKLKLTPAGSFYVPVKTGYSSVGNGMQFKGQFIFSAPMIKALDKEKYEEAVLTGKYTESSILPIKFTIKGGQASTKATTKKTDEEDLRAVIKYVETLIPIALDEIAKGNVEKAPIGKDCCKYCYVKVACGGCDEGDEREERTACTPLAVELPCDNKDLEPAQKGEKDE